MSHTVSLRFRLNGETLDLSVPAHHTLLEVLRYQLDLIGTKQGCDKGDCGACTVMINGKSVLSCVTLAAQCDGADIRTVESLSAAQLHPLADAFDRHVAAQCGFCTPGILMAAEAYLSKVQRPVDRAEAAHALASNLCRCTGYTKILDAVVEASGVLFPEPGRDAHGERTRETPTAAADTSADG